MASGHGADLGLGMGLGGAPATDDATRLDVWPPCGHRQRLAKGGAMGSPLADDAIATGTAIGGGAGRALVAGSCCKPCTIAWTSCNILSEASSRRSILDKRSSIVPLRPAAAPATGRTTCWRVGSSKSCTTCHSAGGGPTADCATAALLAAAAHNLVATELWRRGRPQRTFLDGAILQHIVEEPILSEQLNAWKLPPHYS